MPENPYAALGLDPRLAYTDDEVRAAWRRAAAATHPDRADGGDTARYSAASAAYAELKTGFGRTEALADARARTGTRTGTRTGARSEAPSGLPAEPARTGGLLPRVRAGRPWYLLVRALLVVLVCWGCVVVAGWQPATLAILVGGLTWLALTTRGDIAARR